MMSVDMEQSYQMHIHEGDREIEMESDEEDLGDDDLHYSGLERPSSSSSATKPMTQAEKRAHHNALERKRRDHIKDSFVSLRDSVPNLHGEKTSRAQILKKAAEYIQYMRRKNSAHQHDIEDLKRQNLVLENQIKTLERTKSNGSVSESNNGVSSGVKLSTIPEARTGIKNRHSDIITAGNFSNAKRIKTLNSIK